MGPTESPKNREKEVKVGSGGIMLLILLILWPGSVTLFIWAVAHLDAAPDKTPWGWTMAAGALLFFSCAILLVPGFFALQPNEARVLVLFGKYKGTVRDSGFYWGNPFYSRMRKGEKGGYRISLRARNMVSEKLKVNDKRGNPVEIAAVIVWRVRDTAQAIFDVDNYQTYLGIQSESAIRHLASLYAYDHGEEHEVTLQSGVDEVSEALRQELQTRLDKAGVDVEEARLTHLAYAPEIAQAMLRRQQAEAVIAARTKIVHGAVTMVEMALKELAEKHVVVLDDERKAAMVSNLMVVLCGEAEVHPVINTGTLYA